MSLEHNIYMEVHMSYNLIEELKKRILVLDGAMGTMIQGYNLEEGDFKGALFTTRNEPMKGNNDILSLTRGDIIKEIHCKYYEAGSNIVETNTLNSTSISQSDYGMEKYVYEMNKRSAEIAKEAKEEFLKINPNISRFVAGSIGPTSKSTSLSPDVSNPAYRSISFDELMEAYQEQIRGLMDGGVDLLLIETIIDGLNAKAALVAAQNIFIEKNYKLPIIISATVTDKSGRLLSGQLLDSFMLSMKNENVICMGLNCSFGAKELIPFVKDLANKLDCFISVYPNAGFRDLDGEFDEKPHETGKLISDLVEGRYINLVGGCCGTTPQHIEEIAKVCKDKEPRKIENIEKKTMICGLETVCVDKKNNFLNIGERTNVAGSKKFARLIGEKKYEEALQVAKQQVENGAQAIDINFDDAMLDAEQEMEYFLRLIASEPEIAKVPIVIDSSKWEVIEIGLKSIQGKHIVNSISLKDGEKAFIEKASFIKRFGAAVVVMAFDEKGQADNYERKIEVCERAYDILTNKVNFPPEDIIFDPNILAIGTGIDEHNNYAVDFIEAIKWIKNNLPYAKVSGGISNLSFAFRGNNTIREAMHSVFLYYAISAGLDMGILNPAMIVLYEDIPKKLLDVIENVVLNKNEDSLEKLLEYSSSIKNKAVEQQDKQEEWRTLSINKRLVLSIVKGTTAYIEKDVLEAIDSFDSVLSIVEGPLMDGMKEVGVQFGDGKMFLPQVLKSARVMKKAVEILKPHIENEKKANNNIKENETKNHKILLATVKGDVHDIGKNIVSVVLSCNSFDVIDMGIMVNAEDIIAKAQEINADVIGLSGLITPSLEEMVNVAELLQKKGLDIPLMIGGATTSSTFAAVKLDTVYSGAVIHVTDASKSVEVCKQLTHTEKSVQYIKEVKLLYSDIRNRYYNANKSYISIEKARENKTKLDFENSIVKPRINDLKIILNYSINDLRNSIDWTYLFIALGMNKKYPDILEDEKYGDEAKKVMNDINIILDEISKKNTIKLNAVLGIFPANSIEDDIAIYEDENRIKEKCRINLLRNQLSSSSLNSCLSDYIAPKESGYNDYIGAFVLTAGIGVAELCANYEKKGEVYKSTLIRLMADRLAETFANKLHQDVRNDYWGYGNEINTDGIRPAIGYPSIPDHSEKSKLQDLLDFKKNIGVELTHSYMMKPTASVCGLYFAHPDAKYFDIGSIEDEQLCDYAKRKGLEKNLVKQFMSYKITD